MSFFSSLKTNIVKRALGRVFYSNNIFVKRLIPLQNNIRLTQMDVKVENDGTRAVVTLPGFTLHDFDRTVHEEVLPPVERDVQQSTQNKKVCLSIQRMAALSGVLRRLSRIQMLQPFSSPWATVSRRCLPICTVDTNLSSSQLPEDFSQQFSKHIAQVLNKPERLVTVTIRKDLEMCRDGNAKPLVSVQIWSVGVFDEERNLSHTEAIFKFLLPKLDVPEDRLTVLFHPIEKYDAGHLLVANMNKS